MNTKFAFRKWSVLLSLLVVTGCGTGERDSSLDIIGGSAAPNTEHVKSFYPATVGIMFRVSDQKCTAARIDQNLFLTAAHCVDKEQNQNPMTIKPSNAQNFEVKIDNIRLSPGFTKVSKSEPDLATFSVQFALTEEKFLFDSLVEVASINYSKPILDQTVVLAGFGCVRSRDVSFLFIDHCAEGTGFTYMKTAKSRITSLDAGLIFPGSDYFFQLPMPMTFSPNVDGYIGVGDSGGPVYNDRNEIIGVNSSTFGISVEKVSAGSTNHNWLGHPENQKFIEAGRQAVSIAFYEANHKNFLFKNGDRYIGAIGQGFPSGEGTMNFADGKVYKGQWAKGVRQGHGEQVWNAGAVISSYVGNWSNDRPNGKGSMIFSNGLRYEGELVNGKMHGAGKMFYADGTVREGTFVDSKREGNFFLTRADGTTTTQFFVRDVLVDGQG